LFYTAQEAAYAELHAHSCWSLREGASSTDEMVGRAFSLGYTALALTDHDNLYGAMEFAKTARERGIKPITGCELSIREEEASEEGAGSQPDQQIVSHLTVLAESVECYRILCLIISLGYMSFCNDYTMVARLWLF
jgi:error-prone DNA polymerase